VCVCVTERERERERERWRKRKGWRKMSKRREKRQHKMSDKNKNGDKPCQTIQKPVQTFNSRSGRFEYVKHCLHRSKTGKLKVENTDLATSELPPFSAQFPKQAFKLDLRFIYIVKIALKVTLTVALLTLTPWAIGQQLETVLYVAMLSNKAQGLYCKILRIRNLRQMARFCNKLLSVLLSFTDTSLDKHTSMNKHTSLLKIIPKL